MKRFKCLTQGPSRAPYCTKRLYNTEMSKPYTYGSICEIMAAGEIFPYKFKVCQDGSLIAVFGDALQGIRRLWFTGNFYEGHFDALVLLDEAIINSIQLSHFNEPKLLTSTEQIGCEKYFSFQHGYNCKYDVCKSDESTPSIQSKRGTKRRKRFTSSIRYKQVRKAVLKFTQSHPEVHRDAVRKYTQSHPEVHRDAVRKYTQSHLEVHRDAVRKYTQSHPEINRDAVQKYIQLDEIVNLGPRLPCSWCHALKWKDETQGMCCSEGKVQLPTLEPYPKPLHSLLTHQDPLSEHFLSTIRKYNGCFQMTSFGAKEIKEGNFMPTFKVQGQVYHRIGSLMARANQKPSFLQIYFMGDDHREKDIRWGIYPGIKPELMSQLQKSLHEHNKYIMDFKAAIGSVPKDQKEFKVVINAERKPFREHKGRFTAPQTKEVAVVIVGQEFEK
ncbi:ATP-dependent DNA helicase [Trichonephila clavipes]|nr:ATP-dependent DNA helicase [Trichonephila clavipes]